MSDTGRASVASISVTAGKEFAAEQDGACAAGTFVTRLVPRPNRKPLDLAQRLALSALITSGRMIRRTDGFGTNDTTLITRELVVFLKSRGYAVPSFDGHTIYPSEKAKNFIAEEGHA